MPHTTDLAKTHAFWLANEPTSFRQLAGQAPDSASQLPVLNTVALNEPAGKAAAATSSLSDLSPKWTTEAEILADQHFYLPPEWPAVCTEGREKIPAWICLSKDH